MTTDTRLLLHFSSPLQIYIYGIYVYCTLQHAPAVREKRPDVLKQYFYLTQSSMSCCLVCQGYSLGLVPTLAVFLEV